MKKDTIIQKINEYFEKIENKNIYFKNFKEEIIFRKKTITEILKNYPDLLKIINDNEKFYVLPASINHHHTYSGGLMDHSLLVVKDLLEYTEKLGLKWKNERSPLLIGLFHDLCKIDNFTLISEKEPRKGWKYNDKPVLIKGHGEKSVILLSKYIILTEEEVICIYWHMGAAYTSKENLPLLMKAYQDFPNCMYVNLADTKSALNVKE